MKTIEGLLDIATKKVGVHKLSKQEAAILEHLSKLAEAFEDNGLQLMPSLRLYKKQLNLKEQRKN